MTDQGLTVRIDIRQIEGFAKALEEHPKEAAFEIGRTVQIALDALKQTVVGYTPVGVTGNLSGGMTTEIRGNPLGILHGELFPSVIYGEPVEFGRAAGRMPPVDAIELWVIRKFGLSGTESRQVAWAIAKSIAARGTKGAGMMEKGFNAARPAITRLFDTLPERILQSLEDA